MKKMLGLLVVLGMLLVGCEDVIDDIVIDSIVLSVDKSEIVADGKDEAKLSWVIKDNDGIALNSDDYDVTILKNGEEVLLSGNAYTTEKEEEVNFTIKYGSITSNVIKVSSIAKVGSIVLSVDDDKTQIFADGEDTTSLSWVIKDNNGNVLSNSEYSAIILKDGIETDATVFSTTTEKNVTFKAQLGSIESNEVIIKAYKRILPLKKDNYWITKDQDEKTRKYIITNDGEDVTINNKTYKGFAYSQVNPANDIPYDDATYTKANTYEGQYLVNADGTYYLQYKYPVEKDDTWDGDGVPVSCIEKNKTVVTPAGTFEGCVVYKKIFTSKVGETLTTYYKPGIGMIKEVKETSTGTLIYNRELTETNN